MSKNGNFLEAKEILVNNQYPLEFIENIFNLTLNKILTVGLKQNNENENDTKSDESNTSIEPSLDYNTCMCMQILEKKLLCKLQG